MEKPDKWKFHTLTEIGQSLTIKVSELTLNALLVHSNRMGKALNKTFNCKTQGNKYRVTLMEINK
jgi:hypothetical protein